MTKEEALATIDAATMAKGTTAGGVVAWHAFGMPLPDLAALLAAIYSGWLLLQVAVSRAFIIAAWRREQPPRSWRERIGELFGRKAV